MRTVCILLVILSALCAAQHTSSDRTAQAGSIPDIAAFFPTADSVCRFPPIDRELIIVCRDSAKDGRHVTFVGSQGSGQALLAVVTLERIEDVRSSIALMVDFEGIQPTVGNISTWTYVYDRNGDGAIDYLAMVEGAAAYKDDDFPDDFPTTGQRLTFEDADYFVGRCRIAFNHWADDNFDGSFDAVVHVDVDTAYLWVDRHIAVRSTKFDGRFDRVWSFRDDIAFPRDSVRHTPARVPIFGLDGRPDAIDRDKFARATDFLKLINRSAKSCGLGKDRFPRERWR